MIRKPLVQQSWYTLLESVYERAHAYPHRKYNLLLGNPGYFPKQFVAKAPSEIR